MGPYSPGPFNLLIGEPICYDLLGVIPDNIYGGRIKMSWLRDTFPESENYSTEVERIRYVRAYILEMIGG
ncbi:hypothetical protein Gotur_002843 [Gossypium turneri]